MALRKIQSGVIADNAITTDKIASGAVAVTDIGDGSINTNKIADAAITSTKLGSTAIQDKLGYTPANTGKAIAMAIVFGGS